MAFWWSIWIYSGYEGRWWLPGFTGKENPNMFFMILKLVSTLLLQLFGGGVIVYQYNVCYSLFIHLLHNHGSDLKTLLSPI